MDDAAISMRRSENLSLSGIVPLEQSKGLKIRVYEALRELIGHMDIYHSTDPIRLDERVLAEQLGVSRTPVREAITRLEQEGFVKVIPRRGAFVVRKTKAEILEMITVWAALESMAARLATSRASDEDHSTSPIPNKTWKQQLML